MKPMSARKLPAWKDIRPYLIAGTCIAAVLAFALLLAAVTVPTDPALITKIDTGSAVQPDGAAGVSTATYPWGGEIETRMYRYFPLERFPHPDDVPADDVPGSDGSYWRFLYVETDPVAADSGQVYVAVYMQLENQ